MGQTLTVDSSVANVVVALLAICTSIGTAQLFNLAIFLYHQLRAHGQPSDGLYWQQQALLRTLPTPTAFVADYMKLWWSWRTKSKKALMRSWIAAVIVLCYAIASIAAGISTSYAVDTTNLEVLVDSSLCRLVDVPKLAADANASLAFATGMIPYIHTYTQNCYQNTTTAPATCRNMYIQPKVPLTVEQASCPWQPSLCLDGERPAISMDSGLLDVSATFGWNLKARDNLWVRRRTTCNVLPLEGREKKVNLSSLSDTLGFEPLPNEQGYAYLFGNYTDIPPEMHPEYLYKASLLFANRTKTYGSISTITRAHSNSFMWGLNWRTLDEMNRTDADVALAFITLNNVLYHNPVNDPLFSAHQEVPYGNGPLSQTEYKSDHLAGALGCAVQHQFCASKSSSDKSCTSLGALPADDSSLAAQFSDLTGLQQSLMKLLWAASFLNDVTNGASSDELLAYGLTMNGLVTELPDNQWAKEVVNWENYAWAGFQIMMSDAAIGPITRTELADSYTNAPATAADSALCQSMRMRKAGGFANVNVFGLAFVLTFSAIISFINFFILRFFIFLKRFRKTLAPRLDRWVNDGIFQLQRRAFEANESTTWIDSEKEIPTTTYATTMSELPTVRRTIRRSATAATLVDKSAILKWELEERQPTITESERSLTARSDESFTDRGHVSQGEISLVQHSSPSAHSR
ncbi:hypothetical protein DPSP01_012021 [Paraphaeosphaeria sporulosa]